MMDWKLRIRGLRGVEVRDIEAVDLHEAERVGRRYCEAHSGSRFTFIQIDGPRVVAGPEILETGVARDQVGDENLHPHAVVGELPDLSPRSVGEVHDRLTARAAKRASGESAV